MALRGRNVNGRPPSMPGALSMFGEVEPRASDNIYTPPFIFEAMGLRFDLDVAAPPGGVPWVPADRYYTEADDGLSQPWHGRVWMNPPYSTPKHWVRKWLAHGNGVAILPLSKSSWLAQLWEQTDAVVILPEQFRFVREGVPHGIFMASALWAIGTENVEAISRVGVIRCRP